MEQIPVSFKIVLLILFPKCSVSVNTILILNCTLWTQKHRFFFVCSSFRCKIRILDSFGTEPDFNHVYWAKDHNLPSPYGALNLVPLQFYTMFRMSAFFFFSLWEKLWEKKINKSPLMCIYVWPAHTPDNTFLGFVVQPHWSDEENKKLESIKRKNQALVYGKRASFWKVNIVTSQHLQNLSKY